jgi:hypothetical protein
VNCENEGLLGGGVRLRWYTHTAGKENVVVLNLGFLGNGDVEGVFLGVLA